MYFSEKISSGRSYHLKGFYKFLINQIREKSLISVFQFT
ncbi:hypothetical protein MmTuc01_1171 [Methanosarcina mazei Tuc01]|uniref:Uncharacterized protein n=1 Tax=Methanosarcina mazei Tuc01 TaxID=1236903 RepID=M1Q2S5_METMZ|nr:hypothetical protein MmTuc01_1171 [Methanosarcina mazei Tuc01]